MHSSLEFSVNRTNNKAMFARDRAKIAAFIGFTSSFLAPSFCFQTTSGATVVGVSIYFSSVALVFD